MKHKSLRIWLVMGIVLCVFFSLGAMNARAETQGAGTVTASALNIRSEADMTSAVVTTVPNGAVVLITGSTDGWVQVWYHGYAGYMSSEYLSVTNAALASFGTGTIAGSNVRIRAEASTDGVILATANSGETMPVTGVSGEWYQVSYNGTSAYVNSSYMTVSYEDGGSSSTGSASTGSISSVTGTGTIQGSEVRIRGEASTSGRILGYLNTGDTVTVTGETGDWYEINYNGSSAYVSKAYTSLRYASAGMVDSSVTGTGMISGTGVRIRSGPSTSYSILGTYDTGTTMTVTGVSGDWYAVSFNGISGFVYSPYLILDSAAAGGSSFSVSPMTSTPAFVVANVHMRSGPDTDYASITVLSAGTEVTITGQSGDWYQVSYNGNTGYVFGRYLTTDKNSITISSSTSAGSKIVEEAKKYLGVSYVYGGTSPSGFDCSGFVYYVYKQCGYTITRTATSQNSDGVYVSRSNLQPGDIIVFYNAAMSGIGHVGIYIGNNQFIHASSGSGKVVITDLSSSYYNSRYYSARRIVS